MIAASTSMITEKQKRCWYKHGYKWIHDIKKLNQKSAFEDVSLHWQRRVMQWLTGNDEGVDGDPVILVLLVWVGTPQAQPGEEGAKKVADQPDDDKGCHQADVAWKLECVDNQSIFSTPEPVKVRIAACLCLFLSFLSFLSVACSQIRGRHSGHAAAHTQQGGVLSPGMPLFPGPLFSFKKYSFMIFSYKNRIPRHAIITRVFYKRKKQFAGTFLSKLV